ncbi:MAG: hypothetical protein Q4D06_00685 [Coriobacteriia bacterium]|nr:hypothetical protein [Coriobacteriia bacterium]
MNEKDLNLALLEAFPELADEFEDYTSWQDGLETGAFLIYEDVFRPRIEKALTDNDCIFAERAFAYVEKLFASGDDYAVNIVTVGILEGLKANCDNDAVRKFLGASTLAVFNELTY